MNLDALNAMKRTTRLGSRPIRLINAYVLIKILNAF
mgnify:FL=1